MSMSICLRSSPAYLEGSVELVSARVITSEAASRVTYLHTSTYLLPSSCAMAGDDQVGPSHTIFKPTHPTKGTPGIVILSEGLLHVGTGAQTSANTTQTSKHTSLFLISLPIHLGQFRENGFHSDCFKRKL